MTGLVDRLERQLYAARTARPSDSAKCYAVLERAVRTCGADSEAFDPTELYLKLATEYRPVRRRPGRGGRGRRPSDALQEQAMTFLRDQERASRKRSAREEELAPESTGGAVGTVALAWLPAGSYEQAIRLWPELAKSDRVAGPDGPLPHAQYCRAMQQQLLEYAEAGMPGLMIAPVQVAPFTAWCAERGHQPDSADARAEYAAHLASNADPGVIAWPPGRNQPCWCGSGRKYKKYCAAAISVDIDSNR